MVRDHLQDITPSDPGQPFEKSPWNLLTAPQQTDLREVEVRMPDNFPSPETRSIFDRFATERNLVLQAACLLVTGIVLLKVMAYKSSPLMTSVLDYIAALAQ